MNYLVFLDPSASELEKILSGTKTMLIKELAPSQYDQQSVKPGDTLYFIRDKDENILRVQATAVRVLPIVNVLDEDLSHTLKEMQPRLQLTEDQYNYWSVKNQVFLVEFSAAQKIPVIQVATDKIVDPSDWMPFEEFSQITSSKVCQSNLPSTK
jgi:hypothetical protein